MAEFLTRIRVVDNSIVDLMGNTWNTSGMITQEDANIFAPYFSCQSGYGMYLASGDITPTSNIWTMACWVKFDDDSNSASIGTIGYRNSPSLSAWRGAFGYFYSNWYQWQVLASNISGGWHHVAFVCEDNVGRIAIDGHFYDTTYTWSTPMSAVSSFGLYCSDGNFSPNGGLLDFCIINDAKLWTDDFTPPQNYLTLPSYAFLSNNNLYTGTSLTQLTNNWSGLTNAEKEALVPSFSDEIPSIQDLATISPFRVLTDEPYPTYVKVTGQPNNITITPTSLINTGSVETIQSINITNNLTDTTVKFSITTDLSTYKIYDATQEEWITSSNIENDGMSIAQINSLTPQILALLDVSNGIAFKHCFIPTSEDASAELSDISAVVDISGSWIQAIHNTDYEVGYPNRTTMSVKLKTNGDYIINYPISSNS